MTKKATDPADRRKARRTPIIDTFSLFVVVPKKGVHRLSIHDVSTGGIGFDLDTEGESPSDFPVKTGDVVDIRLYLNQSLYLPVSISVARIEQHSGIRRVGAEFKDKSSGASKAFELFVQMLDELTEAARIDPSQI